jgi:fluoride exporter
VRGSSARGGAEAAAVVQRRVSRAGFRPAAWAARWGLTAGQVRAIGILVGGAVGALARAGVAEVLPADAGEWPWHTFIVNQVGALLLAWLATELAEVVVPTRFWRPLLGTGFCGAFTTFSAFQVETIEIARHDRPGVAALYAVVSMTVGMACAVAGTVYARRKAYG